MKRRHRASLLACGMGIAVLTSGVLLANATPFFEHGFGHSSGGDSRPEVQEFIWTTAPLSIEGRSWVESGGLNNMAFCASRPISLTVSATVSGAPVEVRVILNEERVMHPGPVTFAPNGSADSFSYVFVDERPGAGHHDVDVHFRSLTGKSARLSKGTMLALYHLPPMCEEQG